MSAGTGLRPTFTPGVQKIRGQPCEPRPVPTSGPDERHSALRSPYPLRRSLPVPGDAEREMPPLRWSQPRRARGSANGRFRDGYWTHEALEERRFIRLLLKGVLNMDAKA